MSRMFIPDQKYSTVAIMHQTFQKITYLIVFHTALHNYKMHISARGYCRNHIQRKAGEGKLNNRSLSFQCPISTLKKVRALTGFILKVNIGAFIFSPFPHLWKNLIIPLLDKFRILLVSTIQRFLTTESELMQQANDRNFTEFDSKPSVNNFGDYRTGPKGKNKYKLPRVHFTNRPEDPPNYEANKFYRPPTMIASSQSIPAIRSISGQSFLDASSCKSEDLNDLFWTLSSLYLLDCPKAYFFHFLRTNKNALSYFT